MCDKPNQDTDSGRLNPAYHGGTSPGVPVGEVLAGEYRPNINRFNAEAEKQQMEARYRQADRTRIHDSEQPQNKGAAPSGAARVIAEAHHDLRNQCSQAPLVDTATRVLKEAIHGQARVQQAAEYLDLAAKHPEVARMIELARGGLF